MGRRPFLLVLVVLVVVAALAGCRVSAADEGGHACASVALDQGVVSRSVFERKVDDALLDLARDGGRIQVWHTGASSASMDRALPDDLVWPPTRGRSTRRTATAEARIERLLGAVELRSSSQDDPPALDLFGAVEEMAATAAEMRGCASRSAVLVTGGGVHRTADLDLLHIGEEAQPVTEATATSIDDVQLAPLDLGGVPTSVVGSGSFEGTVDLSTSFADGVVAVWRRVCVSPCVLS